MDSFYVKISTFLNEEFSLNLDIFTFCLPGHGGLHKPDMQQLDMSNVTAVVGEQGTLVCKGKSEPDAVPRVKVIINILAAINLIFVLTKVIILLFFKEKPTQFYFKKQSNIY